MTELFKSLAAFQQECPTIHKDTQGYGYTYADLPAILKVINPLLKKHKLGFTQLIGEDGIETIIFHTESTACLQSVTPIPQGVQLKGMNDFQVLGSAITYIRRYALSSALGLVTDKDIDASGEQVKKSVKKKPELTKGTEAHKKAIEYISNGGDIEKITEKYNVNPTVLRELKSI